MDREKVVAHAQQFWDRPCQDGVVQIKRGRIINPRTGKERTPPISIARERLEHAALEKDGWEALFVKNSAGAEDLVFQNRSGQQKLIQDSGLDDCVHFISECLMRGQALQSESHFVPNLVGQLHARSDTKTLAVKVDAVAGDRIIGSGVLQRGDVIAYMDETDADYEHCAIYLGNGQIACHTRSRFEQRPTYATDDTQRPWKLAFSRFTFVHYEVSGDPGSLRASGPGLAGWWQIVQGAWSYFYFFSGNGDVGYVTSRPASTRQPLLRPEGRGYWFDFGGHVIVIWRSTGTVERIGFPTSAGLQQYLQLNPRLPLPGLSNGLLITATKLD